MNVPAIAALTAALPVVGTLNIADGTKGGDAIAALIADGTLLEDRHSGMISLLIANGKLCIGFRTPTNIGIGWTLAPKLSGKTHLVLKAALAGHAMTAPKTVTEPAAQAPKTVANKFFEAAEQTMARLSGRWMNESEYEDIAEYQKVLEKVIAEASLPVTITKMTKRPFGCLFTSEGKNYKMWVTAAGRYSYQQVA